MKLSMHTRKNINKDTLLFFDEIQVYPKAIVSLKIFSQSSFNVIVSGSLLGVSLNNISSFPVGYVDTQILYPLNFKEFLCSQGLSTIYINVSSKKAVDEYIHQQINDLLLKYVVVGGTTRYYASSIDWIVDSGLAFKVNKLKTIGIPLKAYRDPQSFKLYLNDTGLLLSMYEENMYLKILN